VNFVFSKRPRKGILLRVGLVPLIAWISVFSAFHAAADPGGSSGASPAPAADDKAVLQPAEADATAQLGKPVTLNVVALHSLDGWAFVWARIEEPDGQPVDYSGTPLADAAANGTASKKYAALLQDTNGQWRVVTSRVGPTDAAWDDWGKQYSAPAQIFVTTAG
jgi:hypothetical protein